MLKLWSFTFAFVLTVCQMYMTQAAPSRMTFDDLMDGVTISNDDPQRLIKVIKELMQKTLDEQELAAADVNSNITIEKRGCNTATCVTHRLADYLSRSGGLGYSNFVPTNVGAQAFGRRRRRGPV
ncbi:calcitonin/calcitonin-related polypeptide, alpha isoform 2-T2 [Synchiropus picturatus]